MKCLTRSPASAASRHTAKARAEMCVESKAQEKRAPSPSVPSSISISYCDPKGPHNKENRKDQLCSVDALSDDEVILSGSSLAEDSGYFSHHNSQIDHCDADTNCAETAERCPEQKQSRLSPEVRCDSKSSCLPVLKFQEEVCKELAKTYRKSQSYDWTIVDKVAENHSLHNIIGPKMGLEYVDVLCGLLKKDMKHILTRILGLLGECDLINCKKVSKTWRKIICQDERAIQRCGKAELRVRDSGRSTRSLSRDFGLSRVVFSCLQRVASSTPVHKSTKNAPAHIDGTLNASKPSRFAEFHEATKSLKGHEALRSCRLCGSPARFDSAMKRAVCMRASCAFDFCSLCQSVYHGSTPCQRGIIKASSLHCQTVPLAGSTRSKRSIRRL